MTTKRHLHIFILSFIIFSFVLPKTENILLAKNVAPIEITIDDNINKQDKQNVTEKDDPKVDIWAIVSAILTIISLLFVPLGVIAWIFLVPVAFMTAIYSLKKIKRHDNLKGKFLDYFAISIFGVYSIIVVILLLALILYLVTET